VFAHTAHIQLLMTAGLPFSMWAFHRLAARVSAARGAALGAAMAATAIACGYYGVFVAVMVGYAVLVVAIADGQWRHVRYWGSLAAGAVVAVLLVLPAFLPYASLQRVQGFARALDEARLYSSNWSDYFASSAYAHVWMLAHLSPWKEVAFAGYVAMGFGLAGLWIARRSRDHVAAIYGGLALLACWASFGPAGGLYSAFYKTIPLFSWLRAPARFGLIVAFSLCVLTGPAVSTLARRFRRPALVAAIVAVLAILELRVESNLRPAEPLDPAYKVLATLPRAPVIEMPFFYLPPMFFMHTRYMLASTSHWMPLVNGYSDYIPPDFLEHVMTLAPFPSRDAFKILEPLGVRYAVVHWYGYNAENRRDVQARVQEFAAYLRPLYADDQTTLFQIVGFPR